MSIDQTEAATLAALIDDHTKGDLILSQSRERKAFTGRYEFRLRTTKKPAGGDLRTSRGPITSAPTHIVLTRDALGTARIYINGVEQAERTIKGNFTNWRASLLMLANDPTGRHPWRGEYQHLALYNRSLSPAEVAQHFAAGPNANSGITNKR